MNLKLSFKLKIKQSSESPENDKFLVEEINLVEFPTNFFEEGNEDTVKRYFDTMRENMKNKYNHIISQYFDVEIKQLE